MKKRSGRSKKTFKFLLTNHFIACVAYFAHIECFDFHIIVDEHYYCIFNQVMSVNNSSTEVNSQFNSIRSMFL
jgi:hypothetical protein